MYKKKLILLLLLCIAMLALLYVCHMLAPLLDDVLKVLAIGAIAGAVLGFYVGVKWKEADLALDRELGRHKDRP